LASMSTGKDRLDAFPVYCFPVTFPCVIVHGGAWNIPQDRTQHTLESVQTAAKRALKLLERSPNDGPCCCSSLSIDAVECAVRYLEDDGMFNAGYGSCLSADGSVEMDAFMMDGSTLRTGAVACVSRVKNPVVLARSVMEQTPHCLVVGQGAERLAQQLHIPMVPSPMEMISDVSRKEWESFRHNFEGAVDTLFLQQQAQHDTVGAVAIDAQGNIACATSTGGITGKRNGRVGDSCLIGCGGYSDSRYGGVSTTGHGESIMKVTLARDIIFGIQSGQDPCTVMQHCLQDMYERVGGKGGAILLSRQGQAVVGFTTSRMAWALAYRHDDVPTTTSGIDATSSSTTMGNDICTTRRE